MAGMVSLWREGCQLGPMDFAVFRVVKDGMRYGKRKWMRYRFDMWTQTDYIVVQSVEERCTIFRNAKRDSMILSSGDAWINRPEYIPCQAELPVSSTCSRCGRLRRHNGAPVHEHSIDRGSASRQERICSGY